MRNSDNSNAFFALTRAGLWEVNVQLLQFRDISFDSIFKLADEQSIVGLIAAGLEHVEDRKVTKPEAVPFLKKVFFLENRNAEMNHFIVEVVKKMQDKGIYTLLVKGQGVAQCYARPQWRSSGDIDFLFDEVNYEKAKSFLTPLAISVEPEDKKKKHLAITIDSWVVELHGLMPTDFSNRINAGIEEVQKSIFVSGNVRVWSHEGVDVFLPSPDNDVIIIFTHFLQHFFVGGIGLRQISDWCRLIWTYHEVVDRELLALRLRKMGIMSEWKAFAHFAVSYMGMPADAMPFYEFSKTLERKSRRICQRILKTGNMGHNKDQSYRGHYPLLIEKCITFWLRLGEFCGLSLIFPWDGPRFFLTYVLKRSIAIL